MFNDLVLRSLLGNAQKLPNKNALYINEKYYTYSHFISRVFAIAKTLEKNTENFIGIETQNHPDTYAAIFALWFTGKAYVPINPDFPKERNQSVIEQVNLKTILSPKETVLLEGSDLNNSIDYLKENLNNNRDLSAAYILFTSGSTGKPKGVEITRDNLAGLINAFSAMYDGLDENDNCLQMFELTFDFSVFAYLLPLVSGACLYTIPEDKIKYLYIYELIEEHGLTFLPMVPSVLKYLSPYFSEIYSDKVKLSLFCGEALHEDVVKAWSNCIPNARVFNVYGPTECTVFCTGYEYTKNRKNDSFNGVLSIGKPLENTRVILIDGNQQQLSDLDQEGELCLSGRQLSPGYWKNEEKNKSSFFNLGEEIYYRTGDLCRVSSQGNYYYVGRIDFQTKIQGFRVELSEIEFVCKEVLPGVNLVAVPYEGKTGQMEIGLCVESDPMDSNILINKLNNSLPSYMIPSKIVYPTSLPMNRNGKIDRMALKDLLQKK